MISLRITFNLASDRSLATAGKSAASATNSDTARLPLAWGVVLAAPGELVLVAFGN